MRCPCVGVCYGEVWVRLIGGIVVSAWKVDEFEGEMGVQVSL